MARFAFPGSALGHALLKRSPCCAVAGVPTTRDVVVSSFPTTPLPGAALRRVLSERRHAARRGYCVSDTQANRRSLSTRALTERGNAARRVASREATETAFGGQPERFPVPRSVSAQFLATAQTAF